MRFIKIPLLALGVVLGYGFAFHSMHHRHHDRDDWEHHIADVCVGAARGVRGDSVKADKPRRENPPPSAESPEP
jgi:uncharacterized membrane protein AbrB (regulator of aidB expression)